MSACSVQVHPCVEASRHVVRLCVRMSTLLYNSCLIANSMSARPTTHFSRHFLEDRREAAAERQTPDRDRQSALQRHNFGMLSVCNHSTAATCPPAGARCRCEADQRLISLDQPCMSRLPPPYNLANNVCRYAKCTVSPIEPIQSSCSPWMVCRESL